MRAAGVALARSLARPRPLAKLPAALSQRYVHSIHRDHDGEWEFDLVWKPAAGFPVRAAWLAAIRRGQRRVHGGLGIDVPVLVMASAKTVKPKAGVDVTAATSCSTWNTSRAGPAASPHVTLVRIDGGLHDLVLSAKSVRERVFDELGRWMTAYLPVGES